ncbi:MAG: hypothetical protein HW392_1347 [Steroidobacteraceae bacterium]|nr:hypothetical protein [Steroidobacteraceae bacterium]
MAEPNRQAFGVADEVDAETIGLPGQRTFRLVTRRGQMTASLWVEKEQLQALGLIMEQQFSRGGRGRAKGDGHALTLAAHFPANPDVDFKVGRLAVAFEEEHGNFVFTANDVEDTENERPPFTFSVPSSQMRDLGEKIGEIVAAGRPRCPLCGAPTDGPHVCPLSNGHTH